MNVELLLMIWNIHYVRGINFPVTIILTNKYFNMCQIDISELPDWDEAAKNKHFTALRNERLEQLKKVEIIKIRYLEGLVCSKFELTPDELRNDTRLGRIVIPRQFLFSLCIEQTKLKEYEIAEYYGFKRGRVQHSKKTIADLRETNRKYREKFEEIEDTL